MRSTGWLILPRNCGRNRRRSTPYANWYAPSCNWLPLKKACWRRWRYSSERLSKSIGRILERAAAAGQVRGDITPEDLLHALIGLCYSYDRPDWQATVMRLVDVFVDGLLVKR